VPKGRFASLTRPVATRREEKERRRAERLAAERQQADAARRRLIVGYIVAGALTLAVVVGLVIVVASGGGGDGEDSGDFPANAHIQPQTGSTNGVPADDREGVPPPAIQIGDLEEAARAAECDLRLGLPDEGNTHIEPNAREPDYRTSPPTSGNHVVPPNQQADGAYAEFPGNIFVVHSLEHGRIAIQYSPELREEDQLAIKGVFEESPDAIVLFPNPEMPYEVAATAWTNLIGCDSYEGPATLDAIRDFRDIYRGQGPEDVPLHVPG
jgi:Protein of unknown function (DUF3105)